MNDKRREQALAVYLKHNTGNANANYYEMRDSAVASMLAFACDQMAEKDAEIARLHELLQQIVRHHDEAMHAAVGDEANYHQMRKNQVLFHLTPNET